MPHGLHKNNHVILHSLLTCNYHKLSIAKSLILMCNPPALMVEHNLFWTPHSQFCLKLEST